MFEKEFIGIRDKNGVPIHEGDKVTVFGGVRGVVKYSQAWCGFVVYSRTMERKEVPMGRYGVRPPEVIVINKK